ncbi:ABC transporter ATP-binding protein [Bifidobacterium crudilactis]|jgi:ATP-binding cassette subfamily B protein|uniref:Fatty acid ABC transporter ATP-binding/permease protein n=1 Tax=Bifidobacterium crudilactis TaxID=327277 RepID=A0A971D061_9BIFI|nr:ABC transporter ATP-binding protein [Bifidobacterium crudilactis]MCI1868754.1 ABC transporter ATP-binding protein/permease [Bifidobacterium crudilactis]MDN5972887.1 ABC transporter ATP-binding protein/permease [Bifidobacterium crudilactis]MDN6000739.1 ABC transporter ATP-binding protein/permease [Bifidobacterium crudilactis]MDN6208809.1 ABC transporter ATP-binding protein/permease [Bifidobacterium crudilactis]MDN6271153.1 ABC transporter ATP-binding protein/permease [Bifidobacterium crudila
MSTTTSKATKAADAPSAEHRSAPKAAPGTTKRLFAYIFAYTWRVTAIIVCILLSAAAQAGSALFLQTLIDTYILPLVGVDNPDWMPLIEALILMGCLYAVGTLSTWLYNWLLVGVEQGTLKQIRDEMFAHQQLLPIRYFDTHEHGDVMSRYTNDTDTLRQAISQSFPQMFSSAVSALAALAAMLWLSIPFTVFTLLFTVVLIVVVRVLVTRSGRYFMYQQQSIGDVNGFVEEAVNGQKVIKIFNHEHASAATFAEKNEKLFEASTQANIYGNITMPVVGNMGYLLYVLLAIVGGIAGIAGWGNIGLSGAGAMTLGTLISLLTLSRSFINPIGQVSMQFNMVMMALAGASRIFALMDEPVEQDDGTVTLVNVTIDDNGELRESQEATQHWAWKRQADDDGTHSMQAAGQLSPRAAEVAQKARESSVTSADGRLTLLRGDVRFTDVTFGYNPSKAVLHDITWFAKAGQKVALVGATGAGKTTVTNLINRFYDIQQGQILYDGIDVSHIRKPDLRHSLGIVLQDVNLFTGTVMDNIRYGRLNATDAECVEAAKLTNADGFIRMLPDGYQTVLQGDGSGLSQGQRQLISIARAAVADPPAMILDEATSSIDTRTESVVQQGMDALMNNRTVFVIAHRLSTVRNADVIMVLDHGAIIERGTHDELIAQRGQYYQLYTGALELE